MHYVELRSQGVEGYPYQGFSNFRPTSVSLVIWELAAIHSHTPSSRFEADFIEMRPGALFLVALRRSYPNPVSGCDNRRNAQRQQFALL